MIGRLLLESWGCKRQQVFRGTTLVIDGTNIPMSCIWDLEMNILLAGGAFSDVSVFGREIRASKRT